MASASRCCPPTASCSVATSTSSTPSSAARRWRWRSRPERYASEIAPARTFGFQAELNRMRDMGLIRGAGLENAVCFTEKVGPQSRGAPVPRRMLPSQGAGPDRGSRADWPPPARARDRRARRSCDACSAGRPDHVRSTCYEILTFDQLATRVTSSLVS